MNSDSLRDAYTEVYYLQDCGGFETYRMSDGKDLDLRLQCMARLAQYHPAPRRVLDLGCGRGELARYFAACGCLVQAVDYSASAIELTEACFAKEPSLRERVTVHCASVTDPAIYHGTYDLVVASDLIEHLAPDELDQVYRLVRAHLAVDGIFVLHSYPNHWFYRYGYPVRRKAAASQGESLPEQPRSPYEQLMHINEQTPPGLRRQLRNQFEQVLLWAGDHQQPVGSLTGKFRIHDWRDAPSLFAIAACRPLDVEAVIGTLSADLPTLEPSADPAANPGPEQVHAGTPNRLVERLRPLGEIPGLGPLLRAGFHLMKKTCPPPAVPNCPPPAEQSVHVVDGRPDPSDWQRAFQQHFRGSAEELTRRLAVYLDEVGSAPLSQDHPLLDLGCGRGDWLALLAERGLAAYGIDSDRTLCLENVARGLHVLEGDALRHLEAAGPNSLGAVSAFHLVEHLSFADLQRLLTAAQRALIPGGLLILETPNPENLRVAACLFYADPTHQRPLLPDLLTFATEFAGFVKIRVCRLHPDLPEHRLSGEGEVVERLNELLHGPRDYAVIGYKPNGTNPAPHCPVEAGQRIDGKI